MREKADESEKVNDIARRLNLAAVYVDGISKSLKGVETDTDGQHKLKSDPVGTEAESLKHSAEIGSEEIVVLVSTKYSKTYGNIYAAYPLAYGTSSSITPEKQAAHISRSARQGDKAEKAPVPPSVEHIACHYNEEILPPYRLEDKPVKQKHNRQENQKFKRIEEHLL